MSFIPKPHEIYKHFKGNLYQIVTIAEHSETGEQLVIYQALYGDYKNYARPLSMFTSRVDKEKYPDVEQEFRFELQGEDSGRQKAESEPQKAESEPQKEESASQKVDNELRKVESESRETDCKLQKEENALPKADEESQEAESEPLQAESEPQELNLDPLVLEFLDADSYEARLNILAGLHHRITDDMITTMAIACDVEVEDGDTQERYESLKNCLLTLEKYECNRIR